MAGRQRQYEMVAVEGFQVGAGRTGKCDERRSSLARAAHQIIEQDGARRRRFYLPKRTFEMALDFMQRQHTCHMLQRTKRYLT